ncbi:hypothetical protein JRO89_XS04G0051200 [Xanthoceras sorbifolium]|uniref:DUF4216 domain-containing protein n=1 Tax=Xanthoceras sorbifolium TaxID=99658 RepID=A0ABQ8I464_9ROSI|nr:hypothetical protein JRO89_XS04G0051200 [Xanthoceras sorbifolium]
MGPIHKRNSSLLVKLRLGPEVYLSSPESAAYQNGGTFKDGPAFGLPLHANTDNLEIKSCISCDSKLTSVPAPAFNVFKLLSESPKVQSSADTSQLSIFSIPGKPFGKADVKELSIQQHEVATFYVLQNCDESQPFIQEHKNMLLDAGNKIVLFDCEWYDTTQEGKGYKRDRYGIITVNIARKLNTQETFVLACQAIQVFYTRGLKDITWSAVTEIKPRNLYEMPVDGGPYQEEIQSISTSYENEDD